MLKTLTIDRRSKCRFQGVVIERNGTEESQAMWTSFDGVIVSTGEAPVGWCVIEQCIGGVVEVGSCI